MGRINAGPVISNPADRADRDNDGWFKISSLFTVMEYGVLKKEKGESRRGPGNGKLSLGNPREKVRFPLRMTSARERKVERSKVQEETLTVQNFNRAEGQQYFTPVKDKQNATKKQNNVLLKRK